MNAERYIFLRIGVSSGIHNLSRLCIVCTNDKLRDAHTSPKRVKEVILCLMDFSPLVASVKDSGVKEGSAQVSMGHCRYITVSAVISHAFASGNSELNKHLSKTAFCTTRFCLCTISCDMI